ncbi:hypothetical protein OROGR_003301 [Orobanche gracilis]
MAALLLKMFAAVFVTFIASDGARVSAQTHHVLGGDGDCTTDLDVGSWLSGRVFRVGDKIWFNCSGTEESIVELEGPVEFQSCDISNPIKMYTESVSHVELEKEGIRYFTSGNFDSCKNGLKLPVPVQPHVYAPPSHEYGPPPHAYGHPLHLVHPRLSIHLLNMGRLFQFSPMYTLRPPMNMSRRLMHTGHPLHLVHPRLSIHLLNMGRLSLFSPMYTLRPPMNMSRRLMHTGHPLHLVHPRLSIHLLNMVRLSLFSPMYTLRPPMNMSRRLMHTDHLLHLVHPRLSIHLLNMGRLSLFSPLLHLGRHHPLLPPPI